MQNARLTERAPFLAEVDILALGHSTPRRVWGMDVSEEGMFLQTTHPFRIGDRVSLRFGVQVDGTEEHEVHIRAAEVRWVRPFEPVAVDGRMAGIGLQFVSIDPPARAALRRFSKPAEREEITLPERLAGNLTSSHTSDVGLGMLPPPTASLPPVTGSIARHATTTPREITEEMLAVSLPPFSTPPRAPRPDPRTSLPPDELMDEVFACTALQQLRSKPPRMVPRDITMLPKSTPPRARSKKPTTLTHPPMHAATDPPLSFDVDVDFDAGAEGEAARRDHPLAGWRFELAVFADSKKNDTAPPTHLSDKARLEKGEPQKVTPGDPAEPPAPKLKLSFDDERPNDRSVLPSIIVEPSILMMESARPQDAASSGPSPAFEEAFLRGEVALADLPTVTERAPSRGAPPQQKHRSRSKKPARSRALVTAAVLIAAGTTVGAGLGFAGKKIARASTPPAVAAAAAAPDVDAASPLVPPLVPPALATDAAPRGVADIERSVPVRAMPDLSATASTQPKPALAPLVPMTPGAKAEKPERADRADKLAAQNPVERKDPKPAKPTKTEGFKLDIPVGDAKVARTFLLAGPSRVVVDLEGGTLPKQSLDGDGKKTQRVRFGAPQPGMSRVVVELAAGVTATDVAASVHDGRLALSFR